MKQMGGQFKLLLQLPLRMLYFLGRPLLFILKVGVNAVLFLRTSALSFTKALFFQYQQSQILKIQDRRKKKVKSKSKSNSLPSKSEFYYDWVSYSDLSQRLRLNISFELDWWWNKRIAQFKDWYSKLKGKWIKRPRLKAQHFLPWVWWLSVLVLIVFSGWWTYDYLLKDLPSPQKLSQLNPPLTTKIYDRHGELLYTVFDEEDRVLVSLDEVSPYLINATVAIEDHDFYHHLGISFVGMARALQHNLSHETVQGGSTITQQLVKNTLLTSERTWQRKLREIILALAVDAMYTKQEILTNYLNEVNYGGSIYGIEQASHWYFKKPARDLNLAESAFLAGLPVAPTAYSPFGPSPELSKQRQADVLRRMVEEGYITQQQHDEALNQELAFRMNRYDIKAPHFVMYVRQLLEQKYGETAVTRGGLEVHTTLDLATQASAEAAVANELDRLGRLRVGNGAALVSDPRSGEILAMVGSRDYFDTQNDGQVNVTLRPRQPGSSIKAVTYTAAFERGYTPTTLLQDTPVAYEIAGSKPYAPRNYDGVFHGMVTAREALASSYNIPAVRLIVDLGVQTVVQKGRAMGIKSWDDSSRFGFSLTLGAGEVTMHDMATVYGTLANNGMTVELNPLLQVKNAQGELLYQNTCTQASSPCNATRTVSPLAAYEVTDVLSDNKARTPAFGPRSVLYIPDHQVAVKTGTTNSLRDNWTIGYTTDRVVVSWVGNNDNQPMSAVASGVTGASPIWRQIMDTQLAQRSSSHAFAVPGGLEKVAVCRTTGTLPCRECPQVVEEIYPQGMAPTKHCSSEMFAQDNAADNVTTAGR